MISGISRRDDMKRKVNEQKVVDVQKNRVSHPICHDAIKLIVSVNFFVRTFTFCAGI